MIKQYLKIIRPHIVAGGLLAFTVGALLGLANGGVFNPTVFAVCYATIFFGDLSTHFSNDYYDVNQDKARHKKPLFSNQKVLPKNPEMLPLTKKIAVALLAASLLIASLAVTFNLAPVSLLLIMIGANFLGWFYSAPPLRLVSRGLGEVAIALAVGFAIPTVGYLSSKGALDSWYGLFVVPFILYAFMLALSLEAPDIESDRYGDKKTLGATKGATAVHIVAFICALAAFLDFLFFAFWADNSIVNLFVFTALSVIPLAAAFSGLLQVSKGKDLQTLSAVNVASLFTINLLIVVYLIMTV
ncbi:MAG: prenyltransferase [Candidatus Bathyarchaeia archaeon]